jgi:hypothetical protein
MSQLIQLKQRIKAIQVIKKITMTKPKFEQRKPKPFQLYKKNTKTKQKFD